ncbi:hypothetical protein STAN_2919 [Streptomyces sp. CBMAI 2042]|uniref:hypothetical protein n=1 Tax=Streptomyces sp. CBMAI 2042 TaxID=2305222 RepID=UPI000F29D6AA|nr:hypothetical protein [Streptomyces sp. CBMAI 2042]RLV67395.1 hypothetical protein STAN_2919 [Streptomyces sp. CBMAI 2042]
MTAVTAMTSTASPAGAAAELRTALREAGLPVGATGTDDYVQLGTLRASDARQLARLIRTGTKRTLKAARALREICEAYGSIFPSCAYDRAASRSGPAGSTTPYGSHGCWEPPRPGRTRLTPTYPTPTPYGTCWRRPSPPPREEGPLTSPYARRRRVSWSWGRSTPVRPGG